MYIIDFVTWHSHLVFMAFINVSSAPGTTICIVIQSGLRKTLFSLFTDKTEAVSQLSLEEVTDGKS